MNSKRIKNKILAIFLVSLNILTVFGSASFAEVKNADLQAIQTQKAPSSIHGFTLKKSLSVNEHNILEYQHEKSGMWAVIEPNNNIDKRFEITVRTPPENDKGTNHIIEHCVLNGSKEYPCKNMIWELRPVSYNTFLNAMTAPCHTTFPVASTDEDELLSLSKIYTSGVFHPSFLTDERIFKKEGIRFELNADGNLTANGTVFNETQSPELDISNNILKTLFPSTQGKNVSGGIPEDIMSLSYDELCETYKKYYHPANMMVYMSGNISYEKFMKFLDEDYLKDYDKINLDHVKYDSQDPSELIESKTSLYYKQETNKKVFSSSAVSILDNSFYLQHEYDFDILSKIINNDSSDRTKFLKDKGYINADLTVLKNFYDPIIAISLDSEKEELITPQKISETITEMFEKYPITQSEIDSVMGKKDFNKKIDRETNLYELPLGSEHFIRSFIRFGDPCSAEYFSKLDNDSKDGPSENELNNLVKTSMLDAKKTILIFKPSSDEKLSSKEKLRLKIQSLQDQKETLTKNYEEQKEWSESPNTEENLNKIKNMFKKLENIETPKFECPLKRTEIKENPGFFKKIKKLLFKNKEKQIEDIPCYRSEQSIGDIINYKMVFNVNNLSPEELDYFEILAYALNNNDTNKRSREELNKLKSDCCQISHSFDIITDSKENNNAVLSVDIIMDKNKSDEAIDLIKEQLFDVNFKNTDSLKKHMDSLVISCDSTPEAHAKFYNILANEISPIFNYLNKGKKWDHDKEFYSDIKSKLSDAAFVDALAERLSSLRDKIFNINSLQGISICSSHENEELAESKLKDVLHSLDIKNHKHIEKITLSAGESQNVACVNKSVSNNNIICVIDCKELRDSAEFDVTCRIITDKFLAQKIREEKGAYGASIYRLPNTNKIIIESHSDPNIASTIDTFKSIPDFIKNLNIEDSEIESISKSILGNLFPKNKLSIFSKQSKLKICSNIDYCCKINSDIANIKKMNKEKVKKHGEILEKAISKMKIYAISNDRKNFDEKTFTEILV